VRPPRRRPVDTSPKSNGRDRPNSRGDATRLLILLKAEELFAERGIEAVPLRDIGIAAGQKNNVAVQYHFRDRENLLREIAAYRFHVSESIRAEQLADIMSNGRTPQVVDLVRAYILALAGHLEEGDHYLAFLSRYAIERGGYYGLEGTSVGSNIHTFMTMIHRLLPDLPFDVVEERWLVMMTSSIHTLARYQSSMKAGILPAPLTELLDDLIAFLAAGLEAAPLDVTAASKR
jgi:AcrR family transcriptional regulator